MSRRREFAAGQEGDFVTLLHGTDAPAESFRAHGIDLGRSNPNDPVIWATQRPIHQPAGWIHGAGWGAAYKQPSFERVVEFKVPRSDIGDQLDDPGNARMRNVRLSRSIRPDEITAIHEPMVKYRSRIAKAKELARQRYVQR
jgi:hypothetical protein